MLSQKTKEIEAQNREIAELRIKAAELEKELEETRALSEGLRKENGKPLRYNVCTRAACFCLEGRRSLCLTPLSR